MPELPPLHWTPVAVFVVTYLLIAVESNRSTYLDRTAAAFCGAVAMVLARVLTLDAAYQSIDWAHRCLKVREPSHIRRP
jgi:di/tricarboxylate transporter